MARKIYERNDDFIVVEENKVTNRKGKTSNELSVTIDPTTK